MTPPAVEGIVPYAKYAGQTYTIPQMWLAGFMSHHPEMSIPDVIQWWHDQAESEKIWRGQHVFADVAGKSWVAKLFFRLGTICARDARPRD